MSTAVRVVWLLAFTLVGAWLFSQAVRGGGPLFYFSSAVSLGIAIGIVQTMRRSRS